jgi:hypothetical protein
MAAFQQRCKDSLFNKEQYGIAGALFQTRKSQRFVTVTTIPIVIGIVVNAHPDWMKNASHIVK